MNVILPTSYFPSINYFKSVNNSSTIDIDIFEHYRRRSLHNRTEILGSNGTLLLTVPIKKKKTKTVIRDIKISGQDWKKKHIHSIKSAYGSSPFFIYYFEDIIKIINTKYDFLIDLNNHILNHFINELEINTNIEKTDTYQGLSYNYIFDIKRKKAVKEEMDEYQQVFGSEFISNLSIIDLIFNLGPNTKNYLNK